MSEVGSVTSSQNRQLVRPPSIRKACDLCHIGKQKCSQTKPSCDRCLQSGYVCQYTQRQPRKKVISKKAAAADGGSTKSKAAKVKKVTPEPSPSPEWEDSEGRPRPGADEMILELFVDKEEPVAGPSKAVEKDKPREKIKERERPPMKKRKMDQLNSVDVDRLTEQADGLAKRDERGTEVLMSLRDYLRCIRTDGHLDSLQLDRIVPYLHPDQPLTPKLTTESAIDETPPAPAEPMQVDPAPIPAPAPVDTPDPPSDAHVHSDLYDEQPFEEEHVELGIEAVPDESPTHIHFAVEESADMRFFARSNSMPPVSSLPPLEMSSLLASQAIPYSPQSHYLTEGLDLAASNRTPTVSTFEAAWALTRPPLITSAYEAAGMIPKSYDPQTIIAQSQFGGGSSPLTPPPPEPRGTRDPSEVGGAGQVSGTPAHNWGFASLSGQHGAYRSTSSAQRAHSVPQSPFPTQHFGSIPHVTGPVSAVGDFVTAKGSEFPVASPFAVDSSMRVDVSLPRHDTYLVANGVQGRGMNGMLHVRDPLDVDVDVDVSNLLNTEMEEDENGVRQVTVVQLDPSAGKQEDKAAKRTCHHVAEVSGTLSALNALGKFSNMSLIGLFPPLTRALEVLLAVALCDRCGVASETTIPHLALLSRTCEVLRHPHPLTPSPLPLVIAGGTTTRTGLAPEIEVHIVDIVWATWRGSSIQKICAAFDKRASDTLEAIALHRSKAVPVPVKTTETNVDELDDEEEEFAVVEEDEQGQKQESESQPAEKMFIERESNGIIWREEKKKEKEEEVVHGPMTVNCIPEFQPGEIRARLFRRAVKMLLGVLSK